MDLQKSFDESIDDIQSPDFPTVEAKSLEEFLQAHYDYAARIMCKADSYPRNQLIERLRTIRLTQSFLKSSV